MAEHDTALPHRLGRAVYAKQVVIKQIRQLHLSFIIITHAPLNVNPGFEIENRIESKSSVCVFYRALAVGLEVNPNFAQLATVVAICALTIGVVPAFSAESTQDEEDQLTSQK